MKSYEDTQITYGTIGYITNLSDVNILLNNLIASHKFINKMSRLIFSFNYKSYDDEFAMSVENELRSKLKILKMFKSFEHDDIHFHHSLNNRGHSFGTCDLDNYIVNYCKLKKYDWLVKTSMDVTIDDYEFPWDRIDLNTHDFFYLDSFSYSDILAYQSDMNFFMNHRFVPQTNFYIIDTSKIDVLVDPTYLKWSYKELHSIEGYNGKPWDYIKEWSCEHFLAICSTKNRLRRKNLLSKKESEELIEFVFKIMYPDPSHKNISVLGICHLHFPTLNLFYKLKNSCKYVT
jgi:hypothetical protein